MALKNPNSSKRKKTSGLLSQEGIRTPLSMIRLMGDTTTGTTDKIIHKFLLAVLIEYVYA